ncbi:MAG: hypothetical protein ACJAYS_000583 [Lentimonas sp.]|jgi:hypothetical protein
MRSCEQSGCSGFFLSPVLSALRALEDAAFSGTKFRPENAKMAQQSCRLGQGRSEFKDSSELEHKLAA